MHISTSQFFLSTPSVAIIQYLAEKYEKESNTFYPKNDPEKRSIIHHRLAFHLSTYQRRVYDYMILPMDYAYERTEDNLMKLQHAVKIFDEFLRRQNTPFVAGGLLKPTKCCIIFITIFV